MGAARQDSEAEIQVEGNKVVVSGEGASLDQAAKLLLENDIISADYANRAASGWSDQKMQELAATATKGLVGVSPDNSSSRLVSPVVVPGSKPCASRG